MSIWFDWKHDLFEIDKSQIKIKLTIGMTIGITILV
jgi:hypothetical protein